MIQGHFQSYCYLNVSLPFWPVLLQISGALFPVANNAVVIFIVEMVYADNFEKLYLTIL